MRYLEELLPLDKLESYGALQTSYNQAEPFPHITFDNFFDEDVIHEIVRDFPSPTGLNWHRYKNGAEKDKLQSTSELEIPPSIRSLFWALNSSTFVHFLERLTGIEGLIPDPHLDGGGLHQTEKGGWLKVHIDYNYHKVWRLDRRLNLILYLNDEWDEGWGGALEFWDRDVEKCLKRILPVKNRVVVFNTSEVSYHGHPDPLSCPQDVTRKSIALYYYSNGRPAEEKAHEHSTVFVQRPNETIKPHLRELARDLCPPVLIKKLKLLRRSKFQR
jgi:Rps23 Pro-64 3,4-dihydroxylase Tpa1-like proline 4-hydroxylase